VTGEADWQTGKPPNELPVEVEHGGEVIGVMAVYGRDGNRPHWKSTAGPVQCWAVEAFNRWRLKSDNKETAQTG
jgi:hypothetical protein